MDTGKCQNCGIKPITDFDIWEKGKKKGKPKTRCKKCNTKNKQEKQMSQIMTNENGIDGVRTSKIKNKGLNLSKWYKFPTQKDFIEDF